LRVRKPVRARVQNPAAVRGGLSHLFQALSLRDVCCSWRWPETSPVSALRRFWPELAAQCRSAFRLIGLSTPTARRARCPPGPE